VQTEDEQLNQFRNWWKESGKPVVLGVLLAISCVVGWNYWQSYQAAERDKAAAIYSQILDSLNSKNPDDSMIVEQSVTLANEHRNLGFVQYVNLLLAKIALGNGNHEESVNTLKEVLSLSRDPILKDMIKIRLARVLADTGKYDEALNLLAKDAQNEWYQILQNDVKGDIFYAQNNLVEARKHYQLAQDKIKKLADKDQNLVIFDYFVQGKLDDLAVGDI